jgi:phosphoglycolate phosphatase-like HAD superfamily hydrolase
MWLHRCAITAIFAAALQATPPDEAIRQLQAQQQREVNERAAQQRRAEARAEQQRQAAEHETELLIQSRAQAAQPVQQTESEPAPRHTSQQVTAIPETPSPAPPAPTAPYDLLARAIGIGLLTGALAVTIGTAVERRLLHR